MTDPPVSPTFELDAPGMQARAQRRGGQFVVLAGSMARANVSDTYEQYVPESYQKFRTELLSTGKLSLIAERPDLLTLVEDTTFSGPTPATEVLLGCHADNTHQWFRTLSDGRRQTYTMYIGAMSKLEPLKATWEPFFHELATKLLDFETRQPELVLLMREVGISVRDDPDEPLSVMDPLTFLLSIKKYSDTAKIKGFLRELGRRLELKTPIPDSLAGSSILHITDARLFSGAAQRTPQEFADLFALTRQALAGDLDDDTFRRVRVRKGVGLAKLTQALYSVNPQRFLPLSRDVQAYLQARGVQGIDRIEGAADLRAVLDAAAQINPDFVALSQAALLVSQRESQVAQLQNGAFPFAQFREEALRYSTDKVKGNLVLDKKYAPLLLEIMSGEWNALSPARSPYSGREQLAVKVALGGGVKADGASFGRALLFGEAGGFEYVPFPVGLTLEVGLPDGKGDGPRRALADPQMRSALLSALTVSLPTSSPTTLTLNTDFGSLKLLPIQAAQTEEVAATLDSYAQGFGKSRRLRVGVSLSPQELESENFPALLEAALSYLDDLTGVLDRLERMPDAALDNQGTIQVPGQVEVRPPTTFTPAPGVPLNQILYGPPGTGKTYRAIDDALAILDPTTLLAHPGPEGRSTRKERYDQLVQEGRISFVTFHQSFGYEDFIEGIKPVMQNGQLSYELQDGVFLAAVRAAGGDIARPAPQAQPPARPELEVRPDAQVWRIYIDGTAPISRLRELSLQRGELRIGSWLSGSLTLDGRLPAQAKHPADLNLLPEDQLNAQQLAFKDSLRVGDLVLLATGTNRIGAVGVVTGDYHFDPVGDRLFATDYAHARSVRWLATDLSLSAQDVTGRLFAQQTLQRVNGATPTQVLAHLPAASSGTPLQTIQAHVLIIDEINRGNIAKIFGELITLLESGKRAGMAEALTATLPLSRRPLSVPQSLYVLGTMNTADRSLTLLDAALRRRFSFRPVWPEPQVLPTLTFADNEALDLRKFLYVINERIERLLSREQVIGHAYLLGLPATLAGVASAVRERILPLLEEYFFEDWGKIREVLADESKDLEHQFIHRSESGGEVRYRLNEAAFGAVEAFSGVYAGVAEKDFPFGA